MTEQEHTLTKQDYECIMDLAVAKFKSDSIRYGDTTFLCKCYVSSILEFMDKNNLQVKNGIVLKKDGT